jgi:hypothetical protein
MPIIAYSFEVLEENVAITTVGPDEPYLVVTVSLTPAEAKTLIETLPSSELDALELRDPVSRAVLEAIKDSPYDPS